MSVFANIFVVAALLCPLASAKVCAEGSCADLHDETSLLQLDKAVKHGHGRVQAQDPGNSAETELMDDSAEVDKDAVKVSSEDELGEEELFVEGVKVNSNSNTFCMNNRYIRIGAGDYFRRANAEKATLGSMGNYQDGYFESNTMDFQEPPKPAWLDPKGAVGVKLESHIDMSSSQVSKFSAQAKAAGTVHAAKLAANGAVSGSHSGTAGFKTVELAFESRRALIESINADASTLRMLKSYHSPRIAISIMRLETQGDFADSQCLDGSAGANGGDATGSVTASASGSASACSQMSASFSPGTVIAYKLGQPVFDRASGKITKIEVAQPCSYLNPSCGCNQFITR